MKESFSIEVKRPVQETFDSLTDLERFASLSEGKLAVAAVPDRPRRGKGSALLLTAQVPGQAEAGILCETLEWEPPSVCTRRFAIKDLPTTACMRFAPCPAGTRVTVDLELDPQSMLYKLMLPALALKLRGDKEKLVAQLQQQLDAQPPS